MLDELARHGYRLSTGTLYPLRHLLVQDGVHVSASEIVAGEVRKYYATDRGRAALHELRPRRAELGGEAPPDDTSHAPARTRRRRSSR